METIIRGLQDHIRYFVIEREPKSLTQTLHLAKLAESIKRPPQKTDKSDLAVLSAQIDNLGRSLSVALTSIQAQQPPNYQPRPHRQQQQQTSMNNVRPQSYGPHAPLSHMPPRRQFNQGPRTPQPDAQWRRNQPMYGQPTRQCTRCGLYNHMQRDCQFINAQCHKCGKIGHIVRVYQSTRRQ